MKYADPREVVDAITAYLASGGLFNPELANHDVVRDLLVESRDAITALQSLQLTWAEEKKALVGACEAAESIGVLQEHPSSPDGHFWVRMACAGDQELESVVWCGRCGVHRVEVSDWTENPTCPAGEVVNKLRAALASTPEPTPDVAS